MLFFAASVSHAGLFTITNRSYGGATAAQQSQLDTFFNEIENQVNAKIPNSDNSDQYGKNLSAAQATSTSLLGADYASTDFKRAMLGLKVSAGTRLGSGQSLIGVTKGDDKIQETKGVGLSSVAFVGMPVAQFTGNSFLAKTKAYLGVMAINKSFSELRVKSQSASLKLQYKFMEPTGSSRMRWNGVDLTSGLIFSKVNLSFSKDIRETKTQDISGAGSSTGTMAAKANIDGELKSFVLPIEGSTSVRMLYFLNFFGGLGADILYSKATATGRLSNSSLNMTSTGISGTVSGTPELNFNISKTALPIAMRSFVGTQIEMGVVALEVAASYSLFSQTWGAGAGLKGYW